MSVEYLIGIVFNNSNILTDSAHVHSQDFCEIVSIAWCLIDLVSQKILSLDQSSICPLNIHDLGDRWDHINSAPPLDDFLLELESKYVNLIGSLDQACIITDGPIPLRQTLHPEALRKNIPLNKLFFSYFDLQKEFSKAYNKSHIPGAYTLPRILRNLALSTDYVLQNNIEDAKMFSKVVLALLQIGHKFTEPQTISVSYNENQFPQVNAYTFSLLFIHSFGLLDFLSNQYFILAVSFLCIKIYMLNLVYSELFKIQGLISGG